MLPSELSVDAKNGINVLHQSSLANTQIFKPKRYCMKNVGFGTRECSDVEFTANVNLEKCFDEVFTAAAQTFRFTAEEQEKFANNEVARLMVAIPFVAGCEDAKRTALAHIAVYITDLRGGDTIFAHTKEDNNSVLSRLRLLSSFKGGNTNVIHHGMTLLALVMLEGYKDSKDYDIGHNQYNPLNDGTWDYAELKHSFINDINENPCTDLDGIMPIQNRTRDLIW